MSKTSRPPYDPYTQKRNISVPYVRYSRAAVKKQNRRFWGVGGAAIALALAAILLAGIAQESESPTVKQELYRIAIPLCAPASAVFFCLFALVIRKAYREGWYCIYSAIEQGLMENRLPVFRTQEEQDKALLGKGLAVGACLLAAALMIAVAVWSLLQ